MKTCLLVKRYPVLIFLFLFGLLLFACSDPQSPPLTEDPSFDRSTPDELLKMLAHSYMEKDLDGYDECLDEDFLFSFTLDIADSLGLPPSKPWWGKTRDLSSTQIMFGSPNVTDIVFSYEVVGSWQAHVEVRADTTYSGFYRRLDPLIEVTTVVGSEDPILKLRVDASWLDVVVVPDRYTNGLYTVLSIREVKKHRVQGPVVSQSVATEASTWGGVKSMFD